MTKKKATKSGAIYTPYDLATAMVNWAVAASSDTVLDLGVGEGTFSFAAFERLLQLGATRLHASQQVFGTEIDAVRFSAFLKEAENRNVVFPHIENADFFNYQLHPSQQFDAVIGNPPYIRRYSIADIDTVRKVVLRSTQIHADDLKNLSDLYIYFVLHAVTRLRVGGRLCVVTADPWLNVGYGRILKKYLLEHFSIEHILTIDRRLFPNADVRAVILHARRTDDPVTSARVVSFTRVFNGLPIERIPIYSSAASTEVAGVSTLNVSRDELRPEKQWGSYFKIGGLYEKIVRLPGIASISDVANTQIGHQTLAKDFFVIPADESSVVESRFLRPLAQAPKLYFRRPIIFATDEVDSYVFCCSVPKSDLQGTKALAHIEKGEAKEVAVRGKGITVKGYHSKKRIQRARRPHWYDIQTHLEKRASCEILVPRFIYHEYLVVWNQAAYVTGELFLEFRPKTGFDTRVYLAILNSSLAELMFRVHAQIYGGGTNNMSPGEFKRVPIVDPNFISAESRERLVQAYEVFVNENLNREQIDQTVFQILGLDENSVNSVFTTLNDLRKLSKTVKKSVVDEHVEE